MNPHTTIRPWLLLSGKQYGIREAYLYRKQDNRATSSDGRPYCTYRVDSYNELSHAVDEGLSEISGNDVTRSSLTPCRAYAIIDLYDSQDGLYELMSMAVGAKKDRQIRSVFSGQCEFAGIESCKDLTNYDQEEIRYHQRLVCWFFVNVEFELVETNAGVDTIQIQLNAESQVWTIDDTGYEEG